MNGASTPFFPRRGEAIEPFMQNKVKNEHSTLPLEGNQYLLSDH